MAQNGTKWPGNGNVFEGTRSSQEECQHLVSPRFPSTGPTPVGAEAPARGGAKLRQKRQEAAFCDQIGGVNNSLDWWRT